MAQIFPKAANRLPLVTALVAGLVVCGAVGFFWYYGAPEYTDVGYRPDQPVKYSHKVHAGNMAIDCRYCHTTVEWSSKANVPPTRTCMNCHSLVGQDLATLELVRSSWEENEPIEWIRIHDLGDYAYFNHAAHVRVGVGCIECHGNVAEMEIVQQVEPLSMGWCLDCHRSPDEYLRPPDQVTNMYWVKPDNHAEWVTAWKETMNINPPEDCSACHH